MITRKRQRNSGSHINSGLLGASKDDKNLGSPRRPAFSSFCVTRFSTVFYMHTCSSPDLGLKSTFAGLGLESHGLGLGGFFSKSSDKSTSYKVINGQ